MNFFALQLLFFAFAFPSVSLRFLCTSAHIAAPRSCAFAMLFLPSFTVPLQFFSGPRHCLSKPGFSLANQFCALPLHIKAPPCISSAFSAVAGYRIAAPRLGCSSPFPAMPSQRPASLGNAVAKHIASIRSYAVAAQVMSMLCHCFTLPCNSFAPRLKAVP